MHELRAEVEQWFAPGGQRHLGVGRYGVDLPQAQPDTRLELGEAERLAHVVVRAAVERRDGVGHGVPGRQDHHRHPGALCTQLLEDLETVESRQAHVEDHQVVVARQRLVQADAAVRDDGRQVSVGTQSLGDERRDPLLVLDDQDPGHVSSSGSAPRSVVTRTAGTSTTNRDPDG